ncbi:4-hydroxyphenylpyruvate dioxygenase [Micromonospora robiginosa]|uniref:4-hydroxyphenylpyruvate dioxygenase n=1 Tax=Micromonospora robiginosa TaxID=2749844 RepID=A0A7L6B3J5_9ACTN|nr:4-hydroxyphenylpyruvate dioxygenase [Micromonospora ferruginea]QLQ36509.1 4-hydroxyphenylpyruvate dioxygenase [Micromonospora ferruginea]
MGAQEIDYVELYTADAEAMTDYFRSDLGFALVARSAGPGRDSVLLRQGTARLVVTTGEVTGAFVEQHGDGIADVAFRCDDVTATRQGALAAGAVDADVPHGGPAVSGFGSVVHTLLPATGTADGLPAGFGWVPSGESRGERPERIALLDHIAVCVERGSLDSYADFYAAGFGLTRYSAESVRVGASSMESVVVRSDSDGVTFTLVAPGPSEGSGQLDAFLSRNDGPGVQHLAFLVDDIVAAVREAERVEFLNTPGTYYDALGSRLAGMREEIADLRATNVLADRDEWGYLLQLFTRSPHPRDTLFYELIQRRGSRGFGSNNIRALYEAVELDRLAAR